MSVPASHRLYDVAQAARRLRVSEKTIRRRIAAGELQAFRVAPNGNVRIPAANVDALLVAYQRRGAEGS